MAIKLHSSFTMPAGVWLKRTFIVPEGISIEALAKELHISRQTLSRILNGHVPLTYKIALRLEVILGTNADSLMRMQGKFDAMQARKQEKGFKAKRMFPRTCKDEMAALPA